MELVEGEEGDFPTHLESVHDGEDLGGSAVCVHHNVEQSDTEKHQIITYFLTQFSESRPRI